MDYVTIATTGNAVDFGDAQDEVRREIGGVSIKLVVYFGGSTQSIYTNTIEFITIAIIRNNNRFGDLRLARNYAAAAMLFSNKRYFGGRIIPSPSSIQ